MAPKKKKTFNQELEGLDQEELSTFNVDKFYTPKMTDDTKKTMLTAVVGKVQKALGEAIAEKNQKTVENEILTASVEEEALQPYKSASIIEHIAYRYAIVAGDSSFRGGDKNKRVREEGSTDEIVNLRYSYISKFSLIYCTPVIIHWYPYLLHNCNNTLVLMI